jgi:hypothetical protein
MSITVELVENPVSYVPTVTTIVVIRDREINAGVPDYYWQFLKYTKFQSLTVPPPPPQLTTQPGTLLTAWEVLRSIDDWYIERIVMTEAAYLATFKALFDAPTVSHTLIAPMTHTRGIGTLGQTSLD